MAKASINNLEAMTFPKSLHLTAGATKQPCSCYHRLELKVSLFSPMILWFTMKTFTLVEGFCLNSNWKYCSLELICANYNVWESFHCCCLCWITLPVLCIHVCCVVCVSSENCSLQSYYCNTFYNHNFSYLFKKPESVFQYNLNGNGGIFSS